MSEATHPTSKNRFTQEFEEWNEVTGALPKGIGWYYECQSIFEDADKEIERLTRERDEAREAYTDENLQKHGIIGKYGRLRAVLTELLACKALREKIDGELSACHQEMSPQLQALENEYQLRKPLAWRDARAALSGEPNSSPEAQPAPASKDEMGTSVSELLLWMVEVAEARDAEPKARTINLKFSCETLRMWVARAHEVLRRPGGRMARRLCIDKPVQDSRRSSEVTVQWRGGIMTLSEFLALRDTDPARYESMLEEVARRAAEAQERLLQIGRSDSAPAEAK